MISVICAAKNRPVLLERCLTSVAYQDIDFEFILVDDSSDEPISHIPSMVGIDAKYVRLESTKDRPPAISFNEGFKNSTGNFVIMMCGDIILSDKDVFRKFLDCHTGQKISLLTYFLSMEMTRELDNIDWKNNPRVIEEIDGFWNFRLPHHSTTNIQNIAAGLTSYATGNTRERWEYIGLFRNEEHHLVSDQDMHLRERCLGFGVDTVLDVCAYHQYHQSPDVAVGKSYIYKNEQQARLLEPAEREK